MIENETNGGPTLSRDDAFGASVSSPGDIDGDDTPDLMVGAPGDDGGGAVYVLFLNTDGTARQTLKIEDEVNGGPNLSTGDSFGASVAAIGDLDGNGIADVAIGATRDSGKGAIYVLLIQSDGSVIESSKIADEFNGGPSLAFNDRFGAAITPLGDFGGDGIDDIAVGAAEDGNFNRGGRGSLYVLFLNANGTVKSSTRIAGLTNGGPTIFQGDRFGTSVASAGDLDGDGITDLAVGAPDFKADGRDQGTVHLLFLNADGSVKELSRIDRNDDGGPLLQSGGNFARSVASLGDLDLDGVPDLVVSEPDASPDAVHVLFMRTDGSVRKTVRIDTRFCP